MLNLLTVGPKLRGTHVPRQQQLLSIDVSCPHGTQQQTRRQLLLLLIDETDKQTGTRPLYDAITTYADPRSMWEANRHPIQGSMGQPAQQEAR